MSISFPLNPVFGQVYTNPTSGDSWKWNGYAWNSLGNVNPIGPAGQTGEIGATGPTGATGATGPGGGTNYFLQNTLPIDPAIGDRWYNTSTGIESVYIYDGFSFQWVSPASSGPQGPTGPNANAIDITYSGTASGLTSTNVQDAIDEIVDANLIYSSNKQMLFNPDGLVGTSLLIDTLYARLVKAEGDLSITLMSGRYTAAAVGNAVFGIYTIGSNGLPDVLLATSAAVDTNITSVQNALLDVPQTLKRGYYALVYNANVTNNFNCSPAASVNPNFGYNAAILAAGNLTCYVASHTYTGTLPLTFPSGAFQTINAPFILVQ